MLPALSGNSPGVVMRRVLFMRGAWCGTPGVMCVTLPGIVALPCVARALSLLPGGARVGAFCSRGTARCAGTPCALSLPRVVLSLSCGRCCSLVRGRSPVCSRVWCFHFRGVLYCAGVMCVTLNGAALPVQGSRRFRSALTRDAIHTSLLHSHCSPHFKSFPALLPVSRSRGV